MFPANLLTVIEHHKWSFLSKYMTQRIFVSIYFWKNILLECRSLGAKKRCCTKKLLIYCIHSMSTSFASPIQYILLHPSFSFLCPSPLRDPAFLSGSNQAAAPEPKDFRWHTGAPSIQLPIFPSLLSSPLPLPGTPFIYLPLHFTSPISFLTPSLI